MSSPPRSSTAPVRDRLQSVSIEPAPATWGGLIRRWRERPGSESAQSEEFRRELGLPTDRPVIMSGHQAEFWHPGILAKYLATAASARRLGAGLAWLVVDQDANTPADIRFPARANDGTLASRTWKALPAASALAENNVPLCLVPPEGPAPVPDQEESESFLRDGLAGVHKSLGAHVGESSVAGQVTAATQACLRPVVEPAPTVFASRLSSTRMFSGMLDRMRTDPGRCARAYNDAVAAHPEARLAPLRVDGDIELPLWHIGAAAGRPRSRAGAKTLTEAAASTLAPRALLMTAMLRMAGCDLFIHGLGGGIYDHATEQWMREWLGVELAPTAVVTATLLLPLGVNAVSPEEIDRAAWRAHHARHDPAMLGDSAAAAEKSRLVQQIRDLKRAGKDASPAFAQLHHLLDTIRVQHKEGLTALERDANEATARRAEASIAHDRTWAFPLYPLEDLRHLKKEIEARFE